jgi:hypothetical protein
MVIYTTATPKVNNNGVNNGVDAELDHAFRTDIRGAWLGPVPDGGASVHFGMALQDANAGTGRAADLEWRIAEPPPYLLVPQSWFEQRFQEASLYFFDPTSTVLVPEPVYVPSGPQFASSLVNGLLQGPSTALASTEENYFPSGLRSLVSVPVTRGLARVDLTSDNDTAAVPSPEQSELLVSQLAWTLQQDPRIEKFQITIDGRPVQLPGETEFSVEHGHEYAPYVAGSSTQLFGLLGGLVVGGSTQNLAPVTGPFGTTDYGLRTVSTDLHAENVAGVTVAGDTLLKAPVKDSGDQPRTLIGDGQDLLRPAWDFSGRLWEVDRQQTGAVVYFKRRKKMVPLQVDGISGEDVKDFLVSRDGSRLIAVIHDGSGNDSIVVSRILTNSEGQVLTAVPAVSLVDPAALEGQVRAIAWSSPTSVDVLRPVSRQLFQVRSVSVDGATSFDPPPVTIEGDVIRHARCRGCLRGGMVGTPAPEAKLYAFLLGKDEESGAVTSAGLSDLAGPRDNLLPIDPRVTMLSYVG